MPDKCPEFGHHQCGGLPLVFPSASRFDAAETVWTCVSQLMQAPEGLRLDSRFYEVSFKLHLSDLVKLVRVAQCRRNGVLFHRCCETAWTRKDGAA